MNMTATNVDLGSVVLEDGPYRDDTLTLLLTDGTCGVVLRGGPSKPGA